MAGTTATTLFQIAVIIQGKRARTRTELEEIAAAFRDVCPDLYAKQIELAVSSRKALIRPTGMSNDGQFMLQFRIIPELYFFVQHRMGADFFHDDENIEMLSRVWSEIRIPEARREQFSGFSTEEADGKESD